MKKGLILAILIGALYGVAGAEGPYYHVAKATSVAVSTSAWTKFPIGDEYKYRDVIEVVNLSTNNAVIYAIGSDTGAPTESTGTYHRIIATGTSEKFYFRDTTKLYLISGHTSAESVVGQEKSRYRWGD